MAHLQTGDDKSSLSQIRQIEEIGKHAALMAEAARLKALEIQHNLQHDMASYKQALQLADHLLNNLDAFRPPPENRIRIVNLNAESADKGKVA